MFLLALHVAHAHPHHTVLVPLKHYKSTSTITYWQPSIWEAINTITNTFLKCKPLLSQNVHLGMHYL